MRKNKYKQELIMLSEHIIRSILYNKGLDVIKISEKLLMIDPENELAKDYIKSSNEAFLDYLKFRKANAKSKYTLDYSDIYEKNK